MCCKRGAPVRHVILWENSLAGDAFLANAYLILMLQCLTERQPVSYNEYNNSEEQS